MVLVAVCFAAISAVPQPSPSGSIAAPAVRLVDLHAVPSASRPARVGLSKLAGWLVVLGCATILRGAVATNSRSGGALCPGLGLLSSPLRT
jgi:hypothetical protein